MPNRKQRRSYKKRKAKGQVADQSGFAHNVSESRLEYVQQRHMEQNVVKIQERRHIESQWPMLSMMAEVPESNQQRIRELEERRTNGG